MRATAIAGLFACVAIAVANGATASAEAPDLLKSNRTQQIPFKLSVMVPLRLEESKEEVAAQSAPKPVAQVHEVVPNETLSTIAEKYGTTWYRLFNKNEQIAHPDILVVGEKVTIPLPDEQLVERPLPQPPVVALAEEPQATVTAPSTPKPVSVSRGSVAGNTYTAGYCTWYAKNMRPDLPNNLGNADTWVARAAAQGLPTGSVPQAGAIGQQGIHVVYVERVNGDGTVFISEMNFEGLYVVSTRTVPASYFQYIY